MSRKPNWDEINRLEIERFKQIDLKLFLIEHYDAIERKDKGSKNAHLEINNETYVLFKNDSGWAYMSLQDNSNKGNIINLVRHLDGRSFIEAKDFIRENSKLSITHDDVKIKQRVRLTDTELKARLDEVRAEIQSFKTGTSQYLTKRGITPSIQDEERFSRNRTNHYGNAIFPYYLESGFVGYENCYYHAAIDKNIKSYTKDTEKGLWVSGSKEASAIAFFETPVDAMSYHALSKERGVNTDDIFYVATGGGVGEKQKDLMAKLSIERERIISAFDAGRGGDKLTEIVESIATNLSKRFEREVPSSKDDWNQDLMDRISEKKTLKELDSKEIERGR